MANALSNSPLARFAINLRDQIADGVGSYIDHWRWDPADAAIETGVKGLIAGVAGAVIIGGTAMTMHAVDYANRVDLAGPQVVAEMSIGEIYQGEIAPTDGPVPARDGPVVRIEGERLEGGTTYRLDGHLIIDGSTPQNCNIRVNGPVTIHGDVGAGCDIQAKLPEAEEVFHGVTMVPMGKTMMTVPATTFNPSGLAFPDDARPGIEVAGHVGEGAKLASNAGIAVGSHDATATLEPGNWGRSLDVTGVSVSYGDGPPAEIGPRAAPTGPKIR